MQIKQIYPASSVTVARSEVRAQSQNEGLLFSEISAPATLPTGQQFPHKVIAIAGALGEVVRQRYGPSLGQFAGHYNTSFLGIDLPARAAAAQTIESQHLPLKPENYFQPGDKGFREALSQGRVQGILIATLPSSHLDYIRLAVESGAIAFVEKPIVLPGQLSELIELYKKYPRLIFALDHSLDRAATVNALPYAMPEYLGEVTRISGKALDKILDRPWIVNFEVSGGGKAMDAMVHLITPLEMLLKPFGISFQDVTFAEKDVFFARRSNASPGRETYAHVRGQKGPVSVDLEVGDGMPKETKYIQIQGTKGTLTIYFKTEDGGTAFSYRPAGGVTQTQRFPKDMAGQRNTTLKIYDQLQHLGQVSDAERAARFWASVRAVETIDRVQRLFKGAYALYEPGTEPKDSRSEMRNEDSKIIESVADALFVLGNREQTGRIKEKISAIRSSRVFQEGGVTFIPKIAGGKLLVIGDLHGDLASLEAILVQYQVLSRLEKGEPLFILFLGDYLFAGLGGNMTGVLRTAMDLLIKYPKNVILLRGNHDRRESKADTRRWLQEAAHGLLSETGNKYKDKRVYEMFVRFLEALPTVAVTGNRIVAAHGAPPLGQIESLRSLVGNEFLQEQMRLNIAYDRTVPTKYKVKGEKRGAIIEQALFESFLGSVGGTIYIGGHRELYPAKQPIFEKRFETVISHGGISTETLPYGRYNKPRFLVLPLDQEMERIPADATHMVSPIIVKKILSKRSEVKSPQKEALAPTPLRSEMRDGEIKRLLQDVAGFKPHGFVFVGGPTGAGKSTVIKMIQETMRATGRSAIVEPVDNYIKPLSEVPAGMNRDHPDVYDRNAVVRSVRALLQGEAVIMPPPFYERDKPILPVALGPQDIIVLDGLHALSPEFQKALQPYMKEALHIYVDAPEELRFLRRLERDFRERGFEVEDLPRFMFLWMDARRQEKMFVVPTRQHAGYVIDREGESKEITALVGKTADLRQRLHRLATERHDSEWAGFLDRVDQFIQARSEVRVVGEYAERQRAFYDALMVKTRQWVQGGKVLRPAANPSVVDISLNAGDRDVMGEDSDFTDELDTQLHALASELTEQFPEYKIQKKGRYHITIMEICHRDLREGEQNPEILPPDILPYLDDAVRITRGHLPFKVVLQGLAMGYRDGTIFVKGYVKGDALKNIRTEIGAKIPGHEDWGEWLLFHVTLGRLRNDITPARLAEAFKWVEERQALELGDVLVQNPRFVAISDQHATTVNPTLQQKLQEFNTKLRSEQRAVEEMEVYSDFEETVTPPYARQKKSLVSIIESRLKRTKGEAAAKAYREKSDAAWDAYRLAEDEHRTNEQTMRDYYRGYLEGATEEDIRELVASMELEPNYLKTLQRMREKTGAGKIKLTFVVRGYVQPFKGFLERHDVADAFRGAGVDLEKIKIIGNKLAMKNGVFTGELEGPVMFDKAQHVPRNRLYIGDPKDTKYGLAYLIDCRTKDLEKHVDVIMDRFIAAGGLQEEPQPLRLYADVSETMAFPPRIRLKEIRDLNQGRVLVEIEGAETTTHETQSWDELLRLLADADYEIRRIAGTSRLQVQRGDKNLEIDLNGNSERINQSLAKMDNIFPSHEKALIRIATAEIADPAAQQRVYGEAMAGYDRFMATRRNPQVPIEESYGYWLMPLKGYLRASHFKQLVRNWRIAPVFFGPALDLVERQFGEHGHSGRIVLTQVSGNLALINQTLVDRADVAEKLLTRKVEIRSQGIDLGMSKDPDPVFTGEITVIGKAENTDDAGLFFSGHRTFPPDSIVFGDDAMAKYGFGTPDSPAGFVNVQRFNPSLAEHVFQEKFAEVAARAGTRSEMREAPLKLTPETKLSDIQKALEGLKDVVPDPGARNAAAESLHKALKAGQAGTYGRIRSILQLRNVTEEHLKGIFDLSETQGVMIRRDLGIGAAALVALGIGAVVARKMGWLYVPEENREAGSDADKIIHRFEKIAATIPDPETRQAASDLIKEFRTHPEVDTTVIEPFSIHPFIRLKNNNSGGLIAVQINRDFALSMPAVIVKYVLIHDATHRRNARLSQATAEGMASFVKRSLELCPPTKTVEPDKIRRDSTAQKAIIQAYVAQVEDETRAYQAEDRAFMQDLNNAGSYELFIEKLFEGLGDTPADQRRNGIIRTYLDNIKERWDPRKKTSSDEETRAYVLKLILNTPYLEQGRKQEHYMRDMYLQMAYSMMQGTGDAGVIQVTGDFNHPFRATDYKRLAAWTYEQAKKLGVDPRSEIRFSRSEVRQEPARSAGQKTVREPDAKGKASGRGDVVGEVILFTAHTTEEILFPSIPLDSITPEGVRHVIEQFDDLVSRVETSIPEASSRKVEKRQILDLLKQISAEIRQGWENIHLDARAPQMVGVSLFPPGSKGTHPFGHLIRKIREGREPYVRREMELNELKRKIKDKTKIPEIEKQLKANTSSKDVFDLLLNEVRAAALASLPAGTNPEEEFESAKKAMSAYLERLQSLCEERKKARETLKQIRERFESQGGSEEALKAIGLYSGSVEEMEDTANNAFRELLEKIYKNYFGTEGASEETLRRMKESTGKSFTALFYHDVMVEGFKADEAKGVQALQSRFAFRRQYLDIPEVVKMANDMISMADDLLVAIYSEIGQPRPSYELTENGSGRGAILRVKGQMGATKVKDLWEKHGHRIKVVITDTATFNTHWVVLLLGVPNPPMIVIIKDEAQFEKIQPGVKVRVKAELPKKQPEAGEERQEDCEAKVYLNPTQEEIAESERESSLLAMLRRALLRLNPLSSGRVKVLANLIPGVTSMIRENGADGAGLTRTEFDAQAEKLMIRMAQIQARINQLGTNEENASLLREAQEEFRVEAESFQEHLERSYKAQSEDPSLRGKPNTWRALDLWPDKNEDFFNVLKELGLPVSPGFKLFETSLGAEILKRQVAAFLAIEARLGHAASSERAVTRVLFPQVDSLDHAQYLSEKILPEARQYAEVSLGTEHAASEVLEGEKHIQYGPMLETPEAVKNMKEILGYRPNGTDRFFRFASVGTNDLEIRLLSAWMGDPLSRDWRSIAPFLKKLLPLCLQKYAEIIQTAAEFNRDLPVEERVAVGFCGEVAGTVEFLAFLRGQDDRYNHQEIVVPLSASMSSSQIPLAKTLLRLSPDTKLPVLINRGVALGAEGVPDAQLKFHEEISDQVRKRVERTEKILLALEKYQERYELAGLEDVLQRTDRVNVVSGIGSFGDLEFLQEMLGSLAGSNPFGEGEMNKADLEPMLTLLTQEGITVPADMADVREAFDFLQEVRNVFQDLEKTDPGHRFHDGQLTRELALPLVRKLLEAQALESGLSDETLVCEFYHHYFKCASIVFGIVSHAVAHYAEEIAPSTVLKEEKHEVRERDGLVLGVIERQVEGPVFSRAQGLTYDTHRFLDLEDAGTLLATNPAGVMDFSRYIAERFLPKEPLGIGPATQKAIRRARPAFSEFMHRSSHARDELYSSFSELLGLNASLSYFVSRWNYARMMSLLLPGFDEILYRFLGHSRFYFLHTHTIRVFDVMEKLPEQKGLLFEQVAEVFQRLRADPTNIRTLRLAMLLLDIIKNRWEMKVAAAPGTIFSNEERDAWVRGQVIGILSEMNILDPAIQRSVVWLVSQNLRSGVMDLLHSKELAKELITVVDSLKKEGGPATDLKEREALLEMLYVMKFVQRFVVVAPEKQVLLPHQGFNSPLPNHDKFLIYAQGLLKSRQTYHEEALARIIHDDYEKFQKRKRGAPAFGGFDRFMESAPLVERLKEAAASPGRWNAYCAGVGSADSLGGLFEEGAETLRQEVLKDDFHDQFDAYLLGVTPYRGKSLSDAELVREWVLLRYLQALSSSPERKRSHETVVTLFEPLSEAQGARPIPFRVVFGTGNGDWDLEQIYTRVLFEHGFDIARVWTSHFSEGKDNEGPSEMVAVGFFTPKPHIPMAQTLHAIHADLAKILHAGKSVWQSDVRDLLRPDHRRLSDRSAKADEIYQGPLVLRKPKGVPDFPTEASLEDRGPVTLIQIKAVDRPGLMAGILAVLEKKFDLRITDPRLNDDGEVRSSFFMTEHRGGTWGTLSRETKDEVKRTIEKVLDADVATIQSDGELEFGEGKTPRSELRKGLKATGLEKQDRPVPGTARSEARIGSQGAAVPAGESPLAALRVLLVEDNSSVQRSLQRLLEAVGVDKKGIQVASNGTEALRIFKEKSEGPEAFDVVLSDIKMPEGEGPETAELIKTGLQMAGTRFVAAATNLLKVPVIFISAASDDPSMGRDFHALKGQDVVFETLPKPFSFEKLEGILKSWAEKKTPRRSEMRTKQEIKDLVERSFGLHVEGEPQELVDGFLGTFTDYTTYRVNTRERGSLAFKFLSLQKGRFPGLEKTRFAVEFMQRLLEAGLPVPTLIPRTDLKNLKDPDDQYIVEHGNGFYLLETMLQTGEEILRENATEAHFYELGRLAARIQNGMEGFKPRHVFRYTTRKEVTEELAEKFSQWDGLMDQIASQYGQENERVRYILGHRKELQALIAGQLEFLKRNLPENGLRETFVHNDLHFANTKFDKQPTVTALFDFNMSRVDHRVAEFNNLVFGMKGQGFVDFEPKMFLATLKGYEDALQVPLTGQERVAIWEIMRLRLLETVFGGLLKEPAQKADNIFWKDPIVVKGWHQAKEILERFGDKPYVYGGRSLRSEMREDEKAQEILRTMKVLIADDEKDVAELVRDLLPGGVSAENVVIKANGREALAYFKDHPVDLIISDIDMPEMRGHKFVEEAMKLEPMKLKRTSVIFMSGKSLGDEDVQQVVEALKQAGTPVWTLSKPFSDFKLLGQTVREIAEQMAAGRSEMREEEKTQEILKAMKVLVVDDAPGSREMMQRILPGCGVSRENIVIQASGAEALEYLRNNPVDLIISDIKMPGMNGPVFVREAMKRKPTAVIFMSGDSLGSGEVQQVIAEFKTAGIPVGQFSKPFRLPAAHAIVKDIAAQIAARRSEMRVRTSAETGKTRALPESFLKKTGEITEQFIASEKPGNGGAATLRDEISRANGILAETFERLDWEGKRTALVKELQALYLLALPYYIQTKARQESPVHRIARVMDFTAEIMIGERASEDEIETGLLVGLLHDVGNYATKLTAHPVREIQALPAGPEQQAAQKQAIEFRMEHIDRGIETIEAMILPKMPGESILRKRWNEVKHVIRHHTDLTLAELDENPSAFRLISLRPQDRVLGYHREANRLWMITADGIAAELRRDKGGDPLAKLEKNIARHKGEAALYGKVLGAAAAAKYGFKGGFMYRSATGYAIFLGETAATRDAFTSRSENRSANKFVAETILQEQPFTADQGPFAVTLGIGGSKVDTALVNPDAKVYLLTSYLDWRTAFEIQGKGLIQTPALTAGLANLLFRGIQTVGLDHVASIGLSVPGPLEYDARGKPILGPGAVHMHFPVMDYDVVSEVGNALAKKFASQNDRNKILAEGFIEAHHDGETGIMGEVSPHGSLPGVQDALELILGSETGVGILENGKPLQGVGVRQPGDGDLRNLGGFGRHLVRRSGGSYEYRPLSQNASWPDLGSGEVPAMQRLSGPQLAQRISETAENSASNADAARFNAALDLKIFGRDHVPHDREWHEIARRNERIILETLTASALAGNAWARNMIAGYGKEVGEALAAFYLKFHDRKFIFHTVLVSSVAEQLGLDVAGYSSNDLFLENLRTTVRNRLAVAREVFTPADINRIADGIIRSKIDAVRELLAYTPKRSEQRQEMRIGDDAAKQIAAKRSEVRGWTLAEIWKTRMLQEQVLKAQERMVALHIEARVKDLWKTKPFGMPASIFITYSTLEKALTKISRSIAAINCVHDEDVNAALESATTLLSQCKSRKKFIQALQQTQIDLEAWKKAKEDQRQALSALGENQFYPKPSEESTLDYLEREVKFWNVAMGEAVSSNPEEIAELYEDVMPAVNGWGEEPRSSEKFDGVTTRLKILSHWHQFERLPDGSLRDKHPHPNSDVEGVDPLGSGLRKKLFHLWEGLGFMVEAAKPLVPNSAVVPKLVQTEFDFEFRPEARIPSFRTVPNVTAKKAESAGTVRSEAREVREVGAPEEVINAVIEAISKRTSFGTCAVVQGSPEKFKHLDLTKVDFRGQRVEISGPFDLIQAFSKLGSFRDISLLWEKDTARCVREDKNMIIPIVVGRLPKGYDYSGLGQFLRSHYQSGHLNFVVIIEDPSHFEEFLNPPELRRKTMGFMDPKMQFVTELVAQNRFLLRSEMRKTLAIGIEAARPQLQSTGDFKRSELRKMNAPAPGLSAQPKGILETIQGVAGKWLGGIFLIEEVSASTGWTREASRAWIAAQILRGAETLVRDGKITNAKLQALVDSVTRFSVTGRPDPVRASERKGVHVSLPVLDDDQLEELVNLAPLLTGFAVALNTNLYLYVKGMDAKALQQRFDDAATHHGILLGDGQFRIIQSSVERPFESLKQTVPRDAFLASDKTDLPVDRKDAALWFNSPQASGDIERLVAEITEAVYASLDETRKGRPAEDISKYSKRLADTIMAAIQASLKILVSA